VLEQLLILIVKSSQLSTSITQVPSEFILSSSDRHNLLLEFIIFSLFELVRPLTELKLLLVHESLSTARPTNLNGCFFVLLHQLPHAVGKDLPHKQGRSLVNR
jgi:hypothetical protein